MAVSDVFHYAGLTYWGPLSESRMAGVLDRVALPERARVLDIGCGRGEALAHLGERGAGYLVGVDRSEAALAQARDLLADRAPDAHTELVCAPAAELDYGEAGFDVALWLGGPYLGGDLASTAATLRRWVAPGGFLLLGHGFWSAPPPADYLEATGIPADELATHGDNLELLAGAGRLMYTCVSNRDEWDQFEGTILYNVERYAAAHPDAPDPDGRLDHRRRWNMAQQRWGREVMGFALYLLQRTPD